MRNKNLWYRERELCGAEDDLKVMEARGRFETEFTKPGVVCLDKDLYEHRVRLNLRHQLPGIYAFLREIE